ncbi:MAG: hypothetical protein GC205_11550 [Bacteroidetes bacterium]|nr:hypothetical protein [Bacteroidota bacterium]
MEQFSTAPAPVFKRIVAFGLDILIGLVLVVVLLFFQESFRTKRAFDKDVHYELGETGIPQYFRYTLDSFYEGEAEPQLFLKGIKAEKEIAFPIILLAPWLVFTLIFAVLGASPGKLLMGLRVRDEQGGKISAGKASVRYFGKWISALPVFIGFFLAFSNPRRQALHDKLNKTLVVST